MTEYKKATFSKSRLISGVIFIIFGLGILFNFTTEFLILVLDPLPDRFINLGMFARPAQITEEEVSVSKEKKICLVCKGKLGGVMFMCIDCGTLYCIKCSEALSNLENACWACNAPIDETKPSKPYKEEEEEVEIEASKEAPKKPRSSDIPPKKSLEREE